MVCLQKMVKIVFGAVGAEGLGNISIDEKFGRLENGTLDKDMVTQVSDSHRTLPVSEDSYLDACLVGR
jgi:hypothetical protein